MRKTIKILVGSLLALVLISSCNNSKMKVPEGILKPNELKLLLVDIHLIDGMLQFKKTVRKEKEDSAFNYYPAILKKHGISREMFDSTILFYTQYPEEFAKIYDEVLEDLSKMEGDRRELIDAKSDSLE